MTAYYNEHDPYAAAWLRNLIAAGLIAPGHVDDRSIEEVHADDLRGFTQCHFFAGIGGWSFALRLAGWDDARPVWTGSCPCQPFSEAGERKGFEDERHLWPMWFDLVRQCRPPIMFGEQVPEAIKLAWFDAVANDLEGEGYAVGAAVLSGCLVEARQERERLWFVACANGKPVERLAEPRRQFDSWPTEYPFPRVAHGIPHQRNFVRAFGNSIIPQVAAQFIRASQ